MKLKYITWLPVVILMILIFNFSAKNAVESDGSSLQISNVFINFLETIHGGDNISDNLNEDFLLQVNHVIRKMAHALEYLALSFSIALHLFSCGVKRKKMFLLSVLFSAIYAATDEFHQLFVPGRCGRITDIMIDTAGATIGAVFFLLLLLFIQKRNTK